MPAPPLPPRRDILAAFLALALLGKAAAAQAQDAAPASLRQCYDWARNLSTELKSRAEDILQSGARARASLGGALPRVEWEWADTWQDPKGVDALNNMGFSGFAGKSQAESKFSVRQPLFSGLREFSARSGFKRESARDALRLQRAAGELFARTAGAFYAVLAAESQRDNTRDALALAEDRVKDLQRFQRLGKARASEVFTAQAHAAALKAALQQTQGRIHSAREDLSLLTGQELSALPLLDEISSPPGPVSLEQALAQARGRADLRAQKEDLAGKALRVRYEKGSYWPAADLTGNYYTQRATFLNVIRWDVRLALRMPLFQGGMVSAKVSEAESAYRQSSLAYEELERGIAYSIRRGHGEFAAAVQESQSLEEAALAAQKSYDVLLEEYRLGLVTNLEVLQALDLLQSQRSARDIALLKAKRLFVDLNVAMEKLP